MKKSYSLSIPTARLKSLVAMVRVAVGSVDYVFENKECQDKLSINSIINWINSIATAYQFIDL